MGMTATIIQTVLIEILKDFTVQYIEDKTTCSNVECSNHDKLMHGVWCADCGSKIVERETVRNEQTTNMFELFDNERACQLQYYVRNTGDSDVFFYDKYTSYDPHDGEIVVDFADLPTSEDAIAQAFNECEELQEIVDKLDETIGKDGYKLFYGLSSYYN